MEVMNNYAPAQPLVIEKPVPITNTVIKEVPVLPNRPLTPDELNYLMTVEKNKHRRAVIGSISGTVVGVGMVAGIGVLMYKMMKLSSEEELEKQKLRDEKYNK